MKNLDEKFEELLAAFDFKAVYKAMRALNWTWYRGDDKKSLVPSIKRMKHEVRFIYGKMKEGRKIIAIGFGGFNLRRVNRNKDLALNFVVAHRNTDKEFRIW